MRVTGWRCAVCAAEVDIATSFPWRCPNATADDRRHVLQIVEDDAPTDIVVPGDLGAGNQQMVEDVAPTGIVVPGDLGSGGPRRQSVLAP